MNVFRIFGNWLFARSTKTRRLTRARLGVLPLEDRVVPSVNPIVTENQLPGTPQSVWDIVGAGDATNQGFATDISVNVGQTVSFKINDTAAAPYHIDIYRMGYYGGMGARLEASITSAQTSRTVQPNPLTNNAIGLVDCGNWTVSASWAVPTTAVSGIYFAKVTRDDTGGASQIVFVVRNDSSHSDMVFQTSDSTWEAYNSWGGSSLYHTTLSGLDRAYEVSYNRPFNDRATSGGDGSDNWVFHAEYPMVRWLEANGYDVTYSTDVDADRYGSLILNHKVWMSVGHDEYWSGNEFANVMAARDAGVNLAFFSGNEIFWKTYLAPSIDSSHTANRTIVCYKETHANAITDPNNPTIWTGAWADPRFNMQTDGGTAQNSLSGTLFTVNRGTNDAGTPFTVPYADSQLRFWRNTIVASLQSGQTATLGDYELGYEWDEDVDNGFRPAGLIDLTSTTQNVTQKFTDYGNTVLPGTATHSLTLYRASSGALVFGAGMVQWSWGLDGNHDDGASTPVQAIQQATVNLFADMYVQPGTLQAGLIVATPSSDGITPTSTITAPTNNQSLTTGVAVTITGTATDSGGGQVAGVEVSTDGGITWHKATGTNNWSYSWIPDSAGTIVIKSRATDDSLNMEHPGTGVSVSVHFQATSTAGLVAAYDFNAGGGTTLSDISGNGHNGTIANATWATGIFGSALSFNGQTSQVTIPDAAALHLTAGMTLEAWVKPTANGNVGPIVVKERSGGLDYGLYATDGTTLHPFGATQNAATPTSNDDELMGNSILALNGWTHIAATYDGAVLRFYVNGTQVTSETLNYSLLTGTGALVLGEDATGNNYQGLIDDVRIYNRALNQAEIRSDMSTPLGGTLDSVAPNVLLIAPTGGATVTGTISLTAAASDNVAVGRVQFVLDGNPLGSPITSGAYSLAWNSRTVSNGTHTLSVRATDIAGNTTTSSGVTVTVSNPADTTPPTVVLTGLPSGSSVAGNIVLAAFPSDNVGVASVQFQLNGVNAGPAVTAAPFRLSFDTRTVGGGTYTLTAVATDLAGNTTTSAGVSITIDNSPPTVTTETPASGATSVSTASAITAKFSKAVQSSSISFVLRDASNNLVSTAVTYDSTSMTATLNPNNALAPSTTYTATVSGATDSIGNVMAAPVSWSFTTSATQTGITIFGDSATPAVATVSDPNPVEVGLKFRSDVPGTVTGMRFYKGAGNTGTHVGHLWTSTGTLLATATFSGESASGWQQVSFSSPVSVSANTTYVVSYYAPSGGYSATSGYFASAGADNPPLHALANGVDGGNGVYIYASGGAFPTNTSSSANYWVDVVFNASNSGIVPTVTTESPASNATAISTSTAVSATFNESVTSGSITFTLKDASGNSVAGSTSYSDATHTVTFSPNAALLSSTTYTATISGATDAANNTMAAPFSWSFTTASTSVAGDTIWASSTTPAVATANDPNPIEVGVKFRSDVPGTITGLRFYKGAGNTGVHVGHLWTSTGTLLASATFSGETASGWQQVSFGSPVTINAGTTYIASYFAPVGGYSVNSAYFTSAGVDNGPLHALANGVDGGNGVYLYGSGGGFPGNTYNSADYWVDVVFSPSSNLTPTLTAQSPAQGATGVALTTGVTATFNEAVQSSTVTFTLSSASGSVPATVAYNSSTFTATLTPNSALAAGTTYTATVSGVKDTSGVSMSAPATWTFTTAAATGNSIWVSSATPAVATANDPNPIEVGVKFRSDVPGTVTGLRFYKGAGNTGTHVGHLWTNSGTLLATATFSGESSSGWQQVSFSSPVTIVAGTTYIASYYAPIGGYSATSGYFTSSGADSPPLHALADGVDGGNGVYRYGSGGGFPGNTYSSTNYWVDVVFSPTSGVTPTVSSTTPAVSATGVAVSTVLTATFNEAVQSSTVTFTLKDAAGNSIPATLSYNANSFTASLAPTSALAAGVTYTATIIGVKDLSGVAMTAPYSWTFTTAASATGDTIWASSATPAVATTNDANPIEVGVKFRTDVPGTITGLRFYKGAGNTGTHVGHLWTSTGTLLATATFTGESASGWQQVNFGTPVTISAGTTYVASYYAPNGGYSANGGYFSLSGADNGPLHALANGVDGGNGVYHYSTGGGFPDSSYNSGNYWVDVVFSPTAAPYVTSQTPGPNAIGVALGAAVTATFSAPIQGSSLSFTLTDSTGNAVAGTVSYNSTTSTATFTPNVPLVSAMTYKVSLSATDPGGNATIPVTWSFKTYGVWQQSTQADFNSGTFNGTQYDANAGGIVLSNLFADDFTNSTLGSSWVATAWQSGGGATVANSILTVSANEVLSSQTFTDIPIIGKVSFAALPYQHFGLSTDFGSVNGNSWAVFSTGSTSDTLFARVNVNGVTTDVNLGALPTGFHVYRVQPMPGAFQFFVDGRLVTTIAAAVPSGTPFKIGMSSYIASSSNLQVDWVKQEGGTFTSTILNAGQVVNWGTVNWNAITSAGTSVIVEVRTGNVAVPDASWSGWTTVSNGGTISSPSSQYLQYRVRIITNDPAVTAVFENIMVFWS